MTDKMSWREIMGTDHYAELTGIEVLEAKAGYAKARLKVSQHILNGHGNVHGGAYFTLADYTAAIASNLLGTPTLAVNGSISFLRSVQAGELVAEAKIVKHGRRLNFMTVEIRDSADNLVAVFQASSITHAAANPVGSEVYLDEGNNNV
jgi:acyl-CoA thioesterase